MGGRVAVQSHKGGAVSGRRRVHVHEVQAERTAERVLLQQKSRGRAGNHVLYRIGLGRE